MPKLPRISSREAIRALGRLALICHSRQKKKRNQGWTGKEKLERLGYRHSY